ncbi:hypothetical protein GWI33_010055, partial [Rhynchophorus ferrugineus]
MHFYINSNVLHTKKSLAFPLFVFCTILLSACNSSELESNSTETTAQQPEIELIPEDLVQPKTGSIPQHIPFVGSIQAVNQTSIQSQVNATVLDVSTDVGRQVKQGQILLRLNNQDNAARLAQAKANLTSAQAQADLNRSLVERKRRLFEQGFISKLELEQSQVDYRAQQENVKSQQANVDIALKAAQDAVIRSPITGYITSRQVDIGQTVAVGQ